MARRPSEIDFVSEGNEEGLRGVVSRKAFLGEIIDYQVKIVDRSCAFRRAPGPELGEGHVVCVSCAPSGMPWRRVFAELEGLWKPLGKILSI